MKRNRGFTLIELMVSIAIIAVIAAIAIPGLISAKKSSNLAAAYGNLKSFATAMATYIEKRDDQTYPENLSNVEEYYSHIATKAGYKYFYFSDTKRFVYYAYPEGTGNGSKIVFVDESSRIYESDIKDDNDLIQPTVNLYIDSANRIEDPKMIWTLKS